MADLQWTVTYISGHKSATGQAQDRESSLVRDKRGVYSDTIQLNSTRQREQQLTQFVGRDVRNKNTTDLAVRCSTGSVEFS